MIKKILIANRGEIACRIIRTCQTMGITTVAVYSDADQNALHVEMADEAVYVGASAARESYLNIEKLITAAQRTGADAIHPGYGFVAENASFAQAVIDAGLTFIGPTPNAIEVMGNKRHAKEILKDIPYVPGYTSSDQSDEAFIQASDTIGYPIMVKATAGGGGKGMRQVNNRDDMPDALAGAKREAKQAFGDDTLMLEKAILLPRHIEVQIIGDHDGHVIALGERECSIQRRHQKIVEETPASNLPEITRRAIHETAVLVGEQIGYTNAGTVEFLLDEDGQFYFLEMNTRLQVEHPVTETVYGIDLVRWQIEIAQGTSIETLLAEQQNRDEIGLVPIGHAIEVRIYAEDPYHEFLPVTGDILYWQMPAGIRVDTGIRSGDQITTNYDPMIAKVIAHGNNRITAIRKLNYGLSNLILLGLRHNIPFLQALIMDKDHIDGKLHTRFIDQHSYLLEEQPINPIYALIVATIFKAGNGQAWRNNPNRPIVHHFEVHDGRYSILLTHRNPQEAEVVIGNERYQVTYVRTAENRCEVTVNGHRQTITIIEGADDVWWVHQQAGTVRLKWLTPLPIPVTDTQSEGSLKAPMPGQVISVSVENGQTVKKGDVLMILEAMKMEHRITAPYDGIVEAVRYSVGNVVQADAILLSIMADESSPE